MTRSKVWIYRLLFVCLFVCVFVRLRISPPRIKVAASNFARRFIGVLGKESHTFGKFAPPEAQPKIGWRIGQRAHWTITGRCLAWPAGLGRLKSEQRSIYSTVDMHRHVTLEMCAACGRRIGMCGYTAVSEDGRILVNFSGSHKCTTSD